MGEMPPRTRGSVPGSRRERAAAASVTISAKRFQPGIELEVPVRQVVRLIPQHHRFNHGRTSSGPGRRPVGLQREAPRAADEDLRLGMVDDGEARAPQHGLTQARFGIHQFVGSPA